LPGILSITRRGFESYKRGCPTSKSRILIGSVQTMLIAAPGVSAAGMVERRRKEMAAMSGGR
jgi:hypothetical protein